MSLHTISLADFRSDNLETKASFCAQLLAAFSDKGFVKIKNHGLSREYVAEAFRYNRELFKLPRDKKEAFAHPPEPNPNRGWSHVGQENISAVSGFERGEDSQGLVKDLKENFDCGAPENKLDENKWPEEADLPGFKDFMLGYYDKCNHLHLEIMSALALSLDLSPEALTSLHTERTSELRMLHYTEIPEAQVGDKSVARIAEHTDFGTLTLLMQDGSGGLEILDPKTHEWFAAECEFPELIVNVGDSMVRLMNRRIHSACHRVPVSQGRVKDGFIPARYSIAYFGKPSWGASLKPLAPLVSESWPCAFDEMTGREYELSKLNRVYVAA